MHEPSGATHVATADLYLGDGAHLELETDWRRGLGWWHVDGGRRTRLTVTQAFEEAPHAVRHEVLLEAQHLAGVVLQEHLLGRDGDEERHTAVESLIGEIHSAMVALRDEPSMRSFAHALADHLTD